MWKFGTEYSSNQSLNELVTQLPPAVGVLLGIRGSSDLSTASGYFGLCYYYLAVAATIHASMIGAGIISKEERDRTTEFLVAKPLTRKQIISEKLLAGFANCLLLNIVTTLSSIIMVGYFNHGDVLAQEILKLMVGMSVLQLIFMLVGTAIAAISKNPKSSASIAIVILLFALMLAKMIDMNSGIDGLKYLTPIKYFEAEQLLLQGGFRPIYIILSAIIILLLTWTTYTFYKKRDLKV
jgi:ABC-2 type transport system permease protein